MPSPADDPLVQAAVRDRTAAMVARSWAAQAAPGGFVGRGAEMAPAEVDQAATVVERGA